MAGRGRGYATATDLADWLVRTLGLPFREAHQSPAGSWRWRRRKASALDELPLAAMQAVEQRITADVFAVLSVDNSVKSRAS